MHAWRDAEHDECVQIFARRPAAAGQAFRRRLKCKAEISPRSLSLARALPKIVGLFTSWRTCAAVPPRCRAMRCGTEATIFPTPRDGDLPPRDRRRQPPSTDSVAARVLRPRRHPLPKLSIWDETHTHTHTHTHTPKLSMGWVGLGPNFSTCSGLGWVGSHEMDPWTTLTHTHTHTPV